MFLKWVSLPFERAFGGAGRRRHPTRLPRILQAVHGVLHTGHPVHGALPRALLGERPDPRLGVGLEQATVQIVRDFSPYCTSLTMYCRVGQLNAPL